MATSITLKDITNARDALNTTDIRWKAATSGHSSYSYSFVEMQLAKDLTQLGNKYNIEPEKLIKILEEALENAQ